MFCDDCGSEKLELVQGYDTHSPMLGELYVKDAEVLRCTECNGMLVDARNFKLISDFVRQKETEFIAGATDD